MRPHSPLFRRISLVVLLSLLVSLVPPGAPARPDAVMAAPGQPGLAGEAAAAPAPVPPVSSQPPADFVPEVRPEAVAQAQPEWQMKTNRASGSRTPPALLAASSLQKHLQAASPARASDPGCMTLSSVMVDFDWSYDRPMLDWNGQFPVTGTDPANASRQYTPAPWALYDFYGWAFYPVAGDTASITLLWDGYAKQRLKGLKSNGVIVNVHTEALALWRNTSGLPFSVIACPPPTRTPQLASQCVVLTSTATVFDWSYNRPAIDWGPYVPATWADPQREDRVFDAQVWALGDYAFSTFTVLTNTARVELIFDTYARSNRYILSKSPSLLERSTEAIALWSDGAFAVEFCGRTLSPDQHRNSEEMCQVQYECGEPINTRTGNLWTDATDLVVSSPGPTLAWTRTYNSRGITDPPVGLGPGWQHPYATRLITPSMPDGEPDTVIVISPQGNWLRYAAQGNGQFTPNPGVYHTLVQSSGVYTHILRDQTQHVFDAATGQLRAVIDPQGRELTLSYDGSGRLDTITDARDATRQLTLGYSGSDPQIASVTDGMRTMTYAYDPATDDLLAVTDVMGRPTTYTYQDHLLTRVENALGQPLEITDYEQPYTATSKAISQTIQDGRHLQFAYGTASTVITTTGVDGRQDVAEVFYTPSNTMTGRTLNGTPVEGVAHDANFSPTQLTDAPGRLVNGQTNTLQTDFTPAGLPAQVTNALGETTQVAYDDRNRPTVITDTLNRRTELAYDTANNLIRQTTSITNSFPGFTTVYTYTGDNWLAAQQGPDRVVTAYTRNPLGQVTQMTVGDGTPDALTTSYGYDALGRVVTTTVGVGTPLERVDVTDYNDDDTVARTIQNYVDGTFAPATPDVDVITTYGYDNLGRQVWMQDALGTYDVTHYDAQGRVDWTARNLTPFQVDGDNLPVFQPFDPANPDQNVATLYGYDGLGRTTLVTQTGILTGTFDPATRTFSQATDRVTRTEYDALSRPVTVTLNYRPGEPAGSDVNVQTITQYDGAGNVTWQRDALGRWTQTDYDVLSRPITVTMNVENGDPLTVDAENQGWATITDTDMVQVTRYTPDGQVAEVIANYLDGVFDPADPVHDRRMVYRYDDLGRVDRTTQAFADGDPVTGGTDTDIMMVTAYDSAGRVQATQDPLERWTRTVYDDVSRVGQTIQHCTDTAGNPVATGCASGHGPANDRNITTAMDYDALWRMATTTDVLNHTTQTVYDGVGRGVATIQNYQDGSYDPAAPDTDVTTRQTYDALGRVTASTDAAGATTTTTYDALGRALTMTDALTRTRQMGYDGPGTQRWMETPDGRFTVMQVDGLGRVTTTITNYQDGIVGGSEPVDQDLISTTRYDGAGRPVAMTDPAGRTTRMAYDLRDQLIGVTENAADGTCPTEPCNVVTQYQYDRAGNRVAVIDARGITTRQATYDAQDRQVTMTDGLGQTTSYQYDRLGRMTFTDDPRGAANDVTYTYDAQDRPTGMSATNLAAPISMGYNPLGWRTSLDDATGTTSFTHDALGRITGVSAPTSGSIGYGYNGRGQRTQLTYPDSTVIAYTYFADGQLQDVRQGAQTLASYTYDPAGRMASLTRANGAATTYGYDGADRLRDLHTTVGSTTTSRFQYTVDRLGLRTGVTETLTSSRVITYTYDGLLRLTGATEDPGTVYTSTYDLAGNRTSAWEDGAPIQQLSYNAANQVLGWSYDAAGNLLNDGTTTSTYDARNRLTQQDGTSYAYNGDGVLVTAGPTTYAQDLAAPLSQVLSDSSTSYLYGHQRLAALGQSWYIGDALGSVRQTLDGSGGVLAATGYSPWGVPQQPLTTPFGFTGELHGQDRVQLRARWYDPGNGTFTARDPFAGFPTQPYSLHPYQYAYSAPTTWTDPTGESPGSVTLPEGRAIHKMIQIDFMRVVTPILGYIPGEIEAEYPVEHASKEHLKFQLHETNDGFRLETRGRRTYQTGQVDLIDHRMQQIYEIKPIRSEQTGRAELYWYLSFLPDHAPGTMYPTTPRTIGPWPMPPWSTTHVVRAENRRGVIVYWGAKQSRPRQPQPAAVAACVAVPTPAPALDADWCKHGEINAAGCYCPHGMLPSGGCAPERSLPLTFFPGPLAPMPAPALGPMPAPIPAPIPLPVFP